MQTHSGHSKPMGLKCPGLFFLTTPKHGNREEPQGTMKKKQMMGQGVHCCRFVTRRKRESIDLRGFVEEAQLGPHDMSARRAV